MSLFFGLYFSTTSFSFSSPSSNDPLPSSNLFFKLKLDYPFFKFYFNFLTNFKLQDIFLFLKENFISYRKLKIKPCQ